MMIAKSMKVLGYELNDDKLIAHGETKLSKDVLQYVNKKGVKLVIDVFGDVYLNTFLLIY